MSHSGRVALSVVFSARALLSSALLSSALLSSALLSAALLTSACSSPPPAQSPEVAPAAEPVEPGPTSEPEPSAPAEAAPAEDAAQVQTLFVRDQPAACEAEGARQCLMVRASASEEWRLFYAAIEGFEYEPSYAYELRVAVSPTHNPPADAPSLRYELVHVVSKTKVGM